MRFGEVMFGGTFSISSCMRFETHPVKLGALSACVFNYHICPKQVLMSGVAVPDTCEKLSFWNSSSLASRYTGKTGYAFGLPGLMALILECCR